MATRSKVPARKSAARAPTRAAARPAKARPVAKRAAPARRIDVHHHIVPPAYLEAVGPQRDFAGTWTPAAALEDMDKGGTETSITCIYSGSALAHHPDARGVSRRCNEYAAQLNRDHPGRFGMFATLPMPDVEGCLAEVAYAFDVLKADGVFMMTSYGNRWLGDPHFAPLWAELNRRKAVIFIHPHAPDCCKGLIPEVTPATIEYTADTTRTIASLLFSGTAGRCPDVRFIFSHGGGTVPFLIERFTRLAMRKEHRVTLPGGVLPELRRFDYELAQAAHPYAVSSLRRLVSISQILFGTDYPYRTTRDIVKGLGTCGFSERELRAINRGNALKLFPRFA